MRVSTTDDPKEVYVRDGYYYRAPGKQEEKWIEGECKILRSDVLNAKEFARELMKEDNPRICQQWEHDYFKQMSEQYNSKQVAGALLHMIWDWTKSKYLKNDTEKQIWTDNDLSAIARKIKERMMS